MTAIVPQAGVAAPASDPLAGYRWNHRVVLLFAGAQGRALLETQRHALAAHEAGLSERDMVVLVSSEPGLRRQVDVPAEGFAAVLVGKDGGVKRRWSNPVGFAELAAIVDAMPMRRDEIRLRR